MTRLAAPLCVLLLTSLVLPGAAASDLTVAAWRRLLARSDEPERPVLGLLSLGESGNDVGNGLEADLDAEEEEEEDGLETHDDHLAWLLARDRGAEVAAGLLRRIVVDAELRTPSGRIHRGCLVAAPGRRAAFANTRDLRVVSDYGVEIACDDSGGLRPSALGDPFLQTFLDGVALDVRSFAIGRDHIALDVLLQAGRFERPVARLDTRARFLGSLDLPRYDGVLLSASGTTRDGQPLDLVVEGEGLRYGLRLTPHRLEAPAAPAGASVRALDAGLLVARPEGVGFCRWSDAFVNPSARVLPQVVRRDPVADRATLWELVDHLLPECEMQLLPSGDVWLRADAYACDRVRRSLDALAADAARTVHVEIVARSGDDVVGRVAVPVLTGRTGFFRLGVDRALLLDADVEVG